MWSGDLLCAIDVQERSRHFYLRRTRPDHLLNRQDEEHDPQFEPVIKLTEQVETKTHEENEEVLFKMYVPILAGTSKDRLC